MTGREINPQRAQRILDAAIDVVSDVGYERATVDAIAAKAGVGKATIYRWWSGKPELLVTAVRSRSLAVSDDVDTGSLRGDLLNLVHDLIRVTRSDGPLLSATGTAFSDHPALAEAVRHLLLPPERDRLRAIADRARMRGEMNSQISELAYEVAPAMVFGRFLLTGHPLDDAFAAALVDDVLTPLFS